MIFRCDTSPDLGMEREQGKGGGSGVERKGVRRESTSKTQPQAHVRWTQKGSAKCSTTKAGVTTPQVGARAGEMNSCTRAGGVETRWNSTP